MSITSGTTYAGSIFFKKAAGSPDWMQLAYSTTGLAGFANFNLTSGTVGNVFAGCTGRIENYGNGWYRCTLIQTATASGTSGGPIPVFVNNTDSVTRFLSYAGNASTSIYIFGAQLETGSIATSYIPTTAAPVTRNADVVTLSGAVSGCIGQTEGTIYVEVDIQFNNRNADIIGLDSGSSANGFYLTIRSSSVIELRVRQNSTNALIFQRTGAYPVGINKIAVSYKNGDFAISLNGTTTQVDTSTITMPSVAITRASVVPSVNFTLDQSVRVRSAAIYTTRLTDSELAALTT
jgi:hypothetical protein